MATPISYGTPYQTLIQNARTQIAASRGTDAAYVPDNFWTDDEIFGYALSATTDLWKAVIDLHHEHFLTLNTADVSLQSGVNQLTGVPPDTFRVYLIESTSSSTVGVEFIPRPINSDEFRSARLWGSQTPQTPSRYLRVYYCLTGAGSPQSAPVVVTAPALSAAMSLNFWYIPTLGVANYKRETAKNPIPGESDQAIINWTIAYMRAKERDDRTPDPAWMGLYATEKNNLLASLTPRQEQEPEYVDSIFGSF